MAIEGPLQELALSDVLQLLDLSRKTGTLSVWRDASERPAQIHLDEGAVVGARATGHTKPLGELLLLAGKVTATQIRAALDRQAREPGRLLGGLLVDAGAATASDVRRQLHFQVEELVCALAHWSEGNFRFEEGATPAPEIGVRIATESLLMEAVRRMDEWAAFGSGPADAELVPSLIDAAPAGAVLELQPREWEVLAAIDGERTLRVIAREVGRGELDVAKSVFSLAAAGVVEVGSRRSAVMVDRPARQRRAVEEALEAGRLDEAERLIDGLARGGARPGEAQLLRGRVEAGRGRWAAAVEWMDQAVEADPLLADAYFHLGLGAIRLGDLARAEEALRTYLSLADGAPARRAGAERGMRALAELRRLIQEEGDERAS